MIASILFIFYLILILWSIGRLPLFRNSGLSFNGIYTLFAIKLLFSIALVLVYTYYYTDRGFADIYKYFDDGNAIYSSVGVHPTAAAEVITGIGCQHDDPQVHEILAATHHFDKKEDGYLESNHHLIIRINVLLRFLSYGSIYIHALFFCFLSFIGLMALYRALKQFFEGDTGYFLILPVFLLPSLLFWASGPLNESIITLFLGMLVFTSMKLLEMKNIFVNLLLTIVCLHFLYLAKPFIALSFLISFYVMATFHFRAYTRVITVLIATLAIMWFCYAHDTFICGIASSLISKRNEFVALGLKMKAGSLVDEQVRNVSCLAPIPLIPMGFYDLFLQPFVWSHGIFEKLFGTENLLVLLLTISTIFFFKRPTGAKLQLAAFCFTFFIVNYTLIGITVPIIGALIRYKIFGLLFYLVLLTCCIDLYKIISIIKRSKSLHLATISAKKLLFRAS